MNKDNTVTIWNDGSWQVWGGADSYMAQSDLDYVTSIDLSGFTIEDTRSITVWQDGGHKVWPMQDAIYAENDLDWLATIHLSKL